MKLRTFNQFINESAGSPSFILSEEVESLNPDLHSAIRDHISEEIVNWADSPSSEEEGSALEDFMESVRVDPEYAVYPDGTITVVLKPETGEEDADRYFDFDWVDEDGEDQTSNALDLLNGRVVTEFDPSAETGDNPLPAELAEQVSELFN